MSVISGKDGAVDAAHTVRNWTIDITNELQAYSASNTDGGTDRVAGNGDWSGNYQAYDDVAAYDPGDTFTFTGSIDGAVGVVGLARVENVEFVIDIEAGAIIVHTVNFASAGVLTEGAAVAVDAVVPDPPTSIGTKVEQAPEPAAAIVYAEITDVRTVTLTLSTNNPTFASSGTSGTMSRVEGNFDFSVDISLYTEDFSTLPAAKTVSRVRVYTNATEFWLLEFVMWGDKGGAEVAIEDATPVGLTLQGQMKAFARVGAPPGTQTKGQVVDPLLAVMWP